MAKSTTVCLLGALSASGEFGGELRVVHSVGDGTVESVILPLPPPHISLQVKIVLKGNLEGPRVFKGQMG